MVAKSIGKRRRRPVLVKLVALFIIALCLLQPLWHGGWRQTPAVARPSYDDSRMMHKRSCPVKVFVHDLGYRRKTSLESGKGFGSNVEHGAGISYYSAKPFSSMEHGVFILQKFIHYSHVSLFDFACLSCKLL